MVHLKEVSVNNCFVIGNNSNRFTLIAGPCSIESKEMVLRTATELNRICKKLEINLIFKSSFDKANRTSIDSCRGIGMYEGLEILKMVKDNLGIPVITDVHESWQCEIVAKFVDLLQIPAFLCRQTDLLVAAAKTGKVINVKKGQFLAPWDMKNIVNKLEYAGSTNILLCERGTSFGYNNLIVDMTSLIEMRKLGYPVVFDATHSVQKPGGKGTTTGGNREYLPQLIRAALAIGVDAIFCEVHPDPDNAISDGPNQIHLDDIEQILSEAVIIDDIVRTFKVKT